MATPIFHIGFPKAGSTTLQNQIFPNLLGCHFTDAHLNKQHKIKELYVEVFKKDGMHFNLKRAQTLASDISESVSEDTIIFSEESGLDVIYGYPDVVTKADRLFQIFGGDLKVVIVVREQLAILKSIYRDHPFDPNNFLKGKPVGFAKWIRGIEKRRYFRHTDLLYYHRLIAHYDDLFGAKNVLILPLELMSKNSAAFSDSLGEFIGVDANEIELNVGKHPENVGHSANKNRLRRLHRYFPKWRVGRMIPSPLRSTLIRFIESGGKENIKVSSQLAIQIRNRYAQSNRQLAARCGFDVEALGYSVTES